MHRIAFALAFLLVAGSAAASAAAGPMAVVQQFVDAFNKGDLKAAAAMCASPASVIDDFPPHAWQGATACADWARAWVADAKKNGDTGAVVTLDKPSHVDVTGDRAYVVVRATYAYDEHGKPVKQTGSVFTVVLQKFTAGWRINGWAWADR